MFAFGFKAMGHVILVIDFLSRGYVCTVKTGIVRGFQPSQSFHSVRKPGHLVVDYWDSSIPCCKCLRARSRSAQPEAYARFRGPELWTRQLLEKDRFYSIKVASARDAVVTYDSSEVFLFRFAMFRCQVEWKEMQGNAQLRLMWGLIPSRSMHVTFVPLGWVGRQLTKLNRCRISLAVPREKGKVLSQRIQASRTLQKTCKNNRYNYVGIGLISGQEPWPENPLEPTKHSCLKFRLGGSPRGGEAAKCGLSGLTQAAFASRRDTCVIWCQV